MAQGESGKSYFGRFCIELEEDTETGVCKDGMCGFGEDVIV